MSGLCPAAYGGVASESGFHRFGGFLEMDTTLGRMAQVQLRPGPANHRTLTGRNSEHSGGHNGPGLWWLSLTVLVNLDLAKAIAFPTPFGGS